MEKYHGDDGSRFFVVDRGRVLKFHEGGLNLPRGGRRERGGGTSGIPNKETVNFSLGFRVN